MVKPVDDKFFPARVYAPVEVDALVADDLPVLIAEPVRFGVEVRAFVCERTVVGLSAYIRDGQLAQTELGEWPLGPDEERDARACLERLLRSEVALPPAVVIDVGEIAGRGWAIVEANAAWASGLCGVDAGAVLPVLRRACMPRGQLGAGDEQWLRPRAHLSERWAAPQHVTDPRQFNPRPARRSLRGAATPLRSWIPAPHPVPVTRRGEGRGHQDRLASARHRDSTRQTSLTTAPMTCEVEAVARADIAIHDLAHVEPDAEIDRWNVPTAVEQRDAVDRGLRRRQRTAAGGTDAIGEDGEDGEHRVADELQDLAPCGPMGPATLSKKRSRVFTTSVAGSRSAIVVKPRMSQNQIAAWIG
ncbi:MAG: ATP-grasp domain-containing protein [Nannocystis sp.]|uniref:ATP-grasp domain-containing protein n=1 Tax=Nannocystis sp. TaxID=1962667 RepID=UPI0024233C2B|nr:ATP-grasp domain-containing protein [Nannocystis sp.]MBK9756018.1 ATP-grasp domain-containing protein [Nannocystis sp.]